MKLFSRPLGAYQTNCYLLWDEADACAIVDPGYDEPALDELLAMSPAEPQLLLLTHAHFDHVGGVQKLLRLGAKLYVHPLEETLPQALAPLDFSAPYCPLSDGLEIPFGEDLITVYHTPGHTPGSCCFGIRELLFSGDTLFAGSCGRTDLGGSETDMLRSLARLGRLNGEKTVLPGHGGHSTLTRERRSNPWMREALA